MHVIIEQFAIWVVPFLPVLVVLVRSIDELFGKMHGTAPFVHLFTGPKVLPASRPMMSVPAVDSSDGVKLYPARLCEPVDLLSIVLIWALIGNFQ